MMTRLFFEAGSCDQVCWHGTKTSNQAAGGSILPGTQGIPRVSWFAVTDEKQKLQLYYNPNNPIDKGFPRFCVYGKLPVKP
jgi:hypothetical protein